MKKWLPVVMGAIVMTVPGLNIFVAGSLSAWVSSGLTLDAQGVLMGGFSAVMFSQLHSWKVDGFSAAKATAHGIVGGISSVLSGGKFGHGFAAAGFTQAIGQTTNLFTENPQGMARLGNAAKAALIGGTASKLSGGKFGNGAMTAAFSRVFNDDLFNSKQLNEGMSAVEPPEASEMLSAELTLTKEIDIGLLSNTLSGIKLSTKDGVSLVNPSSTLGLKLPGTPVGAEFVSEYDLNKGEWKSSQSLTVGVSTPTPAQLFKLSLGAKTSSNGTASAAGKGCVSGYCGAAGVVVDPNPLSSYINAVTAVFDNSLMQNMNANFQRKMAR